MRETKPSFGVFMVDIFASSVGIFILVSLLYIIASSMTTSNKAMVERFKELIKNDKVPIHAYSLPHQADPLHDWGTRAQYARQQGEPLILLMRDEVLLYHTMEKLSLEQIVQSGKIREYYDQYNKTGRLFIEIHYHDAYHALKAKIHQALPENVRLWVHWAYYAGNLDNPNPASGHIEQLIGGDSNAQIDKDAIGGSSTGKKGSNGNAISGKIGEGGGLSGANEQGQGQNAQQGNMSAKGDEQDSTADKPSQEQNQAEELTAKAINKAVAKQLKQDLQSNEFIKRLLQSALPRRYKDRESKEPTQQQKTDKNEASEQQALFKQLQKIMALNDSNDKQPSAQKPPRKPTDKTPANKTKVKQPTVAQLAEVLIKKHTFLAVPLYSPIANFRLDVKVPGIAAKRLNLEGIEFTLRAAPSLTAQQTAVQLTQGDVIVPQSPQLQQQASSNSSQWIAVKIMRAQDFDNPQTGWIYGAIVQQVFALPIFENQVKTLTPSTTQYWHNATNTDKKADKLVEDNQ